MDKIAQAEVRRLKKLMKNAGVSEDRIKLMDPVINNTAWMKIKLDESMELVQSSQVVIKYDNGGGQSGLRENPIFKGYEALWKSYMAGMNVIISTLPAAVAKEEENKSNETKSMLELVREKHRKEA